MLPSIVQWFDRVGPTIFWTCALTLLTVDAMVAATFIGAKSRELVNRWTGPVLVVNGLLLGVGLGVPAAMYVTKVAVMAVAPAVPISFATPAKDP